MIFVKIAFVPKGNINQINCQSFATLIKVFLFYTYYQIFISQHVSHHFTIHILRCLEQILCYEFEIVGFIEQDSGDARVVLKVSKTRQKFMVILPKNERWDNFQCIKLSQRSFFGRIQDTIIFFRDYLTFRNLKIHGCLICLYRYIVLKIILTTGTHGNPS